jgi:twitching motility protein PilT
MGRVVATEVLVPTPAIRNLIREGKTHQIYAAVQTSGAIGMQTMDADLARLVRGGRISRALAEQRSSVPEELKRVLDGGEATAMPAAMQSPYNGTPAVTQAPPQPPSYVSGG